MKYKAYVYRTYVAEFEFGPEDAPGMIDPDGKAEFIQRGFDISQFDLSDTGVEVFGPFEESEE